MEDRLTVGCHAPEARSTTAAAMHGDMQAVQALWQEHRRWIAAVILAYKPRSEDLEDLLQEVAMTMVAKIKSVREESNVRAWLRTVAINAARAAGRFERARPVRLLSGLEGERLEQSCERAAPDDGRDGVLERVAQLPEAYREPLMLKAVHGMRSRQIAQIMGIPQATVDTRISRARRMLREGGTHQAQNEPALNGQTGGPR